MIRVFRAKQVLQANASKCQILLVGALLTKAICKHHIFHSTFLKCRGKIKLLLFQKDGNSSVFVTLNGQRHNAKHRKTREHTFRGIKKTKKANVGAHRAFNKNSKCCVTFLNTRTCMKRHSKHLKIVFVCAVAQTACFLYVLDIVGT